MRESDWLRIWLEQWAEWQESNTGYSRTASEAKTQVSRGNYRVSGDIRGSGELTRALNYDGADWMKRLSAVMDKISKRSLAEAQAIAIVKAHYLRGGKAVEGAIRKSSRTERRWRARGEELLKTELLSEDSK